MSTLPFSQKSVVFSAGSIQAGPQTEKPCARAGEAPSRGPTTSPAVAPGPTVPSSGRCCVTNCGPASGYWWNWIPTGKSAQTSPADHGPGSSSAAEPSSDRGPHHAFVHHQNLINKVTLLRICFNAY